MFTSVTLAVYGMALSRLLGGKGGEGRLILEGSFQGMPSTSDKTGGRGTWRGVALGRDVIGGWVIVWNMFRVRFSVVSKSWTWGDLAKPSM